MWGALRKRWAKAANLAHPNPAHGEGTGRGVATKLDNGKTLSELEETLALQLRADKILCRREFRFHVERRWRFDFAFEHAKLAVEVQGDIWRKGKHTSGVGITSDCEKYCNAAILGWRVMPVTGDQVKSGEALGWIKQALNINADRQA